MEPRLSSPSLNRPAGFGIWKGAIRDNYAVEKSLNRVSTETLKVNPDLRNGVFVDQSGVATIYVPVSLSATPRLDAKGSTSAGNYVFAVEVTLSPMSGEMAVAADIHRHYFYFGTERESSTSSGTLKKVTDP